MEQTSQKSPICREMIVNFKFLLFILLFSSFLRLKKKRQDPHSLNLHMRHLSQYTREQRHVYGQKPTTPPYQYQMLTLLIWTGQAALVNQEKPMTQRKWKNKKSIKVFLWACMKVFCCISDPTGQDITVIIMLIVLYENNEKCKEIYSE